MPVPVGALGSTRVDVDSRIHELPPTGPVLNEGPKAALAEDASVATTTVVREEECMLQVVGWLMERIGWCEGMEREVNFYVDVSK